MSDKPASLLKGKRILVAKPGLDGPDIGAKIVALALREWLLDPATPTPEKPR